DIWPGRAFVLSPSPASRALEEAGLLITPENAADQQFDADGLNIVEPRPQWKDPALVADQALRMVHGTVLNVEGREVEMKVRSICVHGDRPNVVEIATAVRKHLEASGVQVKSLYAPAEV
ncbi:MAG: 5-oxoprolinase (ATP-hydrolyzing) subunit, partial [Actinomycetota bacterium]|nr:5-oxoprolinase (ATP-hydrolyzing) subunit [Actinomycetota bacterium]